MKKIEVKKMRSWEDGKIRIICVICITPLKNLVFIPYVKKIDIYSLSLYHLT
jgi:hypothetical protein